MKKLLTVALSIFALNAFAGETVPAPEAKPSDKSAKKVKKGDEKKTDDMKTEEMKASDKKAEEAAPMKK